MVQLRTANGETVEISTVKDADMVQREIAVHVQHELTNLDSHDNIVAKKAADRCNGFIKTAQDNEHMLVPLRERAYIEATHRNASEFVKDYLTAPSG